MYESMTQVVANLNRTIYLYNMYEGVATMVKWDLQYLLCHWHSWQGSTYVLVREPGDF
jgi:hypothetical protein